MKILKLLFSLLLIFVSAQGQQLRDSSGKVSHDSSYMRLYTDKVSHDSIFRVPVPVITPLVNAHYFNSIDSWFTTAAGQDAVIAWCGETGVNRAVLYSVDAMIGSSSNYKWISRFNDSCSAHNIQTGPAWSNPNICKDIDKFNLVYTKPSQRFDVIYSELEPYNNTVSYNLFCSYSRTVHIWALKNGVESVCYIGWEPQQYMDSIAVNYDAVAMHCYIASNRMGIAVYEYGYTNGRCGLLANSCITMRIGDAMKLYPIFSTETGFGYDWYKGNGLNLKLAYDVWLTGFNNPVSLSGASALIKSELKPSGFTTFTSSYSFKIKPVKGLPASAMRVAMEIPKKKLLYVDPETMQSKIIQVIDSSIYKQTKNIE